MANDDRAPVVVGASRWSAGRGALPDVLPTIDEMLARVCRGAIDDAEAKVALLDRVGALVLVPSVPHDSLERTAAVAAALGVRPRVGAMTSYGGESGLNAVNWAADAIESGRVDVAVVAGGQLTRPPAGSEAVPEGAPFELVKIGDPRFGFSASEGLHGALLPHITYAMVETALRARAGLGIEAHRARMGELMSPLTSIASRNPQAWFPIERSAHELVTPTPDNRMVAYPYTKYLNAVTTDQAAAVVLMSRSAADSLGIALDRRVHWWGGDSEVETAWLFSTRPDYVDCPAMQLAQRGALARSGIGLGRIDAFDFYSCFPSAIEMAQRMAGLDAADPRPVSITGGLPYAGGPGAAYTVQSTALAVEQLRDQPSRVVMLSGTGFTFTKNSASILSGGPRPHRADANVPERRTDLGRGVLEIDDRPDGRGRVDAYSVVHARSGAVEYGVVLGLLDSGARFLAHLPPDPDVYRSFEDREGVGRTGTVRAGAEGMPNRFDPDD